MKVKRYLVQDMNEAMIRIKNELGMDAVILNTRKVKKGGLFSFFKKSMLEVVAAIDDDIVLKPKPFKEPPKEKIMATQEPPKREENAEALMALKEMVETLSKKVDNLQSKSLESISDEVNEAECEKLVDEYIAFLKKIDIQESIAKKILEILQRQITIHGKNHETILNAMKVIAREYLGEIKTIDKDSSNRPNVYVFVGPTGVGKTTTLAKIAAKLSLVENKSIGLITADTYRIAAVEQLKTYSEILGIPLEVIYDPSEIKEAFDRFRDKDYILIDTAGRSHRSAELKTDFDELTNHIEAFSVFLVMSMTTSFKDMKSIIDAYGFLPNYRLLFTKLDEATSYGNILNMKVLTGKPLSYFTIGQSVPDDIEDASKEKIIQYIFGDINHS